MMKAGYSLLFALCMTGLTACTKAAASPPGFASIAPAAEESSVAMNATQFTGIDGQPMDLTHFGARAVLVVNTASRCGFTPQYAGLQALYESRRDDGLIIVGVPSNDFGGQEPGTEEEVKAFCEINYGVTFPLTRKYPVSGPDQHPFYAAAVETLGEAAQPKWNFHKILVGADGTPLKAYSSRTAPDDAGLVADIDAALRG